MDLASVDELLTTTRAVRKRLDLERAVEPERIERCIEIALQAPTGSNSQGWHFVVVTEPEPRRRLAELYRRAFEAYRGAQDPDQPRWASGDPRAAQAERVLDSATYLVENLHRVPVHLIPCVNGRVEKAGVAAQASVYGSILPAVWSFMLAARARGLGTAWTTLHLNHEAEAARLLELPEHVTQTALIPVAYYTGEGFRPAKRLPSERSTHWNRWRGARPGAVSGAGSGAGGAG
jgi:nitroreductase